MNEEINRQYKITTEVKKTASILREIITIIMAIAFTTSIVMFLTNGTNTPKEFSKFGLTSIFAFVCVITAIIRFFHGNISYISRTYDLPDYEARARKYNFKLSVDFFFIFTQGILFCALALYQANVFGFYLLFASLFFVDSIWFFVIINFSKIAYKDFEAERSQEHMRALTNWMVSNFITGLIIAVIILPTPKDHLIGYVPLFFALIMLNTILDYGLNRKLYFPIGIKKAIQTTVFVAARFTSAMESSTFDSDLKEKIESVHEIIRGLGLFLYSSHKTERYGEALEDSDKCVKRDISQISSCDIFIALLEEKFSTGVCIELGWASFLGKKIIIIIPSNFEIRKVPMIKGLCTITYCEVIRYENINTLRNNLRSALQTLVSK